MSEFALLDLLLMALATAAAWAANYLAQPPPSEAPTSEPASPPLLAAGLGVISWTGDGFEVQRPATPLDETLRRICIASGYRGIDTFIDGAKLAYEEVTNAFASGDLSSQAYLLSPDVFETFAEAIAERSKRGETVDLMFIGVGAADVLDAGIGNGQAWIDVRFVGAMVSVTRNGDGDVVAGAPNRVVEMAEIWT
ncbi:MAG: Tim44/TimA family putative adaptor protein, partial [Alphaproteobacteria bacterium]